MEDTAETLQGLREEGDRGSEVKTLDTLHETDVTLKEILQKKPINLYYLMFGGHAK